MPWPDIFFKARKPRPEPAGSPPPKSVLEAAKTPDTEPKSPETKAAVTPPEQAPAPAEPAPTSDRSTRTIPVTHGVVLRSPARVVIGPPAEGATPAAIKNIEQLMTEADPVKTLRQTGSIHLLKRLAPDPNAPPVTSKPTTPVPGNTPPPFPAPASPTGQSPWPEFAPKTPPISTEVKKPGPIIAATPPVVAKPPEPVPGSSTPPLPAAAATLPQSPWPEFAPKTLAPAPVLPPPIPVELKKSEPVIASTPTPPPVLTEVAQPNAEEEDESPFILKPSSQAQTKAPAVLPVPETTPLPRMSIFRRRAKLADVARIVLPPKREESTRLPFPPHPESSPTVVPPAFPVVAMTQRPLKPIAEISAPVQAKPEPISESPFLEKSRANEPAAKLAPPTATPRVEEKPKAAEPAQSTPPPFPGPKPSEPMSLFPDPPKIDPESPKPAPVAASAPKVDPEAHRPLPQPASPMENVPPAQLVPPASTALSVSSGSHSPEKREFHLTNGEHVAGVVLSETPEAFYVEHATLGVITVPRKEVAKRLVEIILINGDRIVGDIMAETADTLYVRHASLGMLTVPRAQRSQRVVEAILKDGDRILGEVLTETDTFTVIRSATLGTITVPHTKLAMLNRKLEQIDMKALPSVPELKDKTP
jgi:RNase P/RNase MRP subunit p29